jgi:hypothetical protein
VASRDVHSYALTDQALAFLETGRAFLGPAQQTLRFSDLPLELVVALNAEAKRFNEDRTAFSLLDISYRKEREIVRQHGSRQFGQARELVLQNLVNVLRGEDKVVQGASSDYALLKAMPPEEAREGTAELCAAVTRDVRLDLGLTISVFGPEDFA